MAAIPGNKVGVVNGVPTSGTGDASTIDALMAITATSEKQDAGNTALSSIDGHVDGLETLVGATNTALAAVATETTLADVKTAVEALAALISGGKIPVTASIDASTVNANGSTTDSASAPVAWSTEGKAQVGSLTETAPASDTASSGVNGRLQRLAQRITSLITTILPTATANGTTLSRVNAAVSTNATNLKASAGQVYSLSVFNVAAYTVFLKIYNKASSPTVGTDTPVWTIPIPAGGGFSKVWPMGVPFATGISYAITKLQADSDTTAVAAGDVTGQIMWI